MKNYENRLLKWIPIALAAIAAAAALIVGLTGSEMATILMTRIVIMVLFAESLNLQNGFAGLGNLGHALYFGLGGYALILAQSKLGLPLIPAIIGTVVLLTLISAVFGYLVLKGGDLRSFLFLSMGLCTLVSTAFTKWKFMGNRTGLTYAVRPEWMNSPRIMFAVVFAVVLIMMVLIYLLTRSPFIAAVKGSRENEERMCFIGVNVKKLRLIVYVFSSFFGSIAGCLYAIMNNGAYITSVETTTSLKALLMCLVGGASYAGPIVGGTIVTMIDNYLPSITNFDTIILGVFIIAVTYLLPNGITDPHSRPAIKIKKFLENVGKSKKVEG